MRTEIERESWQVLFFSYRYLKSYSCETHWLTFTFLWWEFTLYRLAYSFDEWEPEGKAEFDQIGEVVSWNESE